MDELLDIKLLPEQYRLLAEDFQQGALSVTRAAIPGLLEDRAPLPATILVREAKIKTRFFLQTQGTKIVFFFRRQTAARIVLDASIRFRISPEIFAGSRPGRNATEIEHFLAMPPFLLNDPASSADFAVALGSDFRQLQLLCIGEGVLGVSRPDDEDRARIGWRPSPGQPIRLINASKPEHDDVAVFINLMETIGRWVAGKDPVREMRIGEGWLPGASEPVQEIFQRLCEAWSKPSNQLGAEVAPGDSLLQSLVPDYEVQDYFARVLLRLKTNGQLALDDSDDPFQLMLSIRIVTDRDRARSHLTIEPPDFLISGDLHASFLAELQFQPALGELASQLGTTSAAAIVKLGEFMVLARSSALVFRVKRDRGDSTHDKDSDVFLYSLHRNNVVETLAAKADFQVTAPPDPMPTYIPGSLKVVFSSVQFAQPIEPQPDLIRYTLRLVATLRNWAGVFQ